MLVFSATRRQIVTGLAGLAGLAGAQGRAAVQGDPARTDVAEADVGQDYAASGSGHLAETRGNNTVVGEVDHAANGFTPGELLTEFDHGTLTEDADGRRVREWSITAVDRELEIAPGVFFPAWTYNGRVPGPTLRCVEGERLRIHFANAGSHPHTIHLHSIHAAGMDGIPGVGQVAPGESFTYEVPAEPMGCHLYHCHSLPLKRHIHKGLYGALVIDPDPERHPDQRAAALGRRHGTPENARWQEFVMVMNGFDTNFDDENEFYAVNTIPFAYQKHPIPVARSRPIRIYLVNATEFDPINSLHLHANFFDYYDHGTTLAPTHRMMDTIIQCQAQRGIVEISFANHEPGLYMFHAHQSEFAELGWMSFFRVEDA